MEYKHYMYMMRNTHIHIRFSSPLEAVPYPHHLYQVHKTTLPTTFQRIYIVNEAEESLALQYIVNHNDEDEEEDAIVRHKMPSNNMRLLFSAVVSAQAKP